MDISSEKRTKSDIRRHGNGYERETLREKMNQKNAIKTNWIKSKSIIRYRIASAVYVVKETKYIIKY